MKPDPFVEGSLAEGIAAFDQRDFRTARKHFSQAVLRQPDNDQARFWLGAAQYHMGNIGEARKHLEQAADAAQPPIADRPAAVGEYLARCYLSQDPDRALAVALEAAEQAPADPRICLLLGDVCLRLQRHEDALKHFDAAWKLEGGAAGEPADPMRPGRVPYARSSVLVRQERWPEARAAIEEALAREPENAVYNNRLGVILHDGLDDAAGAVTVATRATELDPRTVGSGGDGVYWFNLSTYLQALGRFGEALTAVGRAIQLSPRRPYKALRDELAQSAPQSDRPPAPRFGSPPAESPATVDFSKVGGMNALKDQVRRIIAVVHQRRDEAQRYGIGRNGILLYGPPGCGKTFFAEAIAGEFGLKFLRVSLGSMVTKYVGGAPEAIEKVFAEARDNTPCLLFFDEFDSIAGRRDDQGSNHEQQMVNTLLQQIDATRDVAGVVIMAATNRLKEIDPAAIREGRFDYKVKIYRPDFDARREILHVLLRDRPHDDNVDATAMAHAMEGFSAAQVRSVVDGAAMAAMETHAPISPDHLEAALQERIAERRYDGPRLEWNDLILPTEAMRKLQFVERFIENPQLVRELGVDPPTGWLLHGPPGTGKTTIARVLASQTDASFFAVNAADVFSKWFGQSEQRVREIFEQARDNVPAIIFIDEIDSVLGSRAEGGSGGTRAANAVVNTFLAEMDGIAATRRIFVVGATNRPELVDDAALRPGRLSEAIEIGLPDIEGRLALLGLFTRRMKLGEQVDLASIAIAAQGASGADLRGLCTAAGRNAVLRELDSESADPAVTAADFSGALEELFPERAWASTQKIGFLPGKA